MDNQTLNLARKWRSKTFDQIVGQELPVKMLKNSLYLNHYFPVYLFAGQKGCGKTSTARVFAAAINCDRLTHFQKDPKSVLLPCLECSSCSALMAGKHPDFIEIDAASNTGVDNVRQIIDSSALLPLMGRKKIYLIDEAHMLSKAAFNAFLKLMEEPPASVIFILATTDTQKIIDTVRSRCFQLHFRPIEQEALQVHLAAVCQQENISCDEQALSLIVKETNGSARDALNLLEQVRFSDDVITRNTVYRVLGHLDDQRLLTLFEIVLYKRPFDLITFFQEQNVEKFSAELLWHKITELLRACIWIMNGVTPASFSDYVTQLQFLLRGKTLKDITHMLELFYTNEPMFRRTTAQHAFLEVMLLRLCQKNESNSNSNMPAMASPQVSSEELELEAGQDEEAEEDSDADYEEENALPHTTAWKKVIEKIEVLKDPLLSSIFTQGMPQSHDAATGILLVEFPQELQFFNDIIESTKEQWHSFLQECFGTSVRLSPQFTLARAASAQPAPITPKAPPAPVITRTSSSSSEPVKKYPQSAPNSFNRRYQQKPAYMPQEQKIDVSDKVQWPFAHMLLQHFPGTITQVRDTV